MWPRVVAQLRKEAMHSSRVNFRGCPRPDRGISVLPPKTLRRSARSPKAAVHTRAQDPYCFTSREDEGACEFKLMRWASYSRRSMYGIDSGGCGC